MREHNTVVDIGGISFGASSSLSSSSTFTGVGYVSWRVVLPDLSASSCPSATFVILRSEAGEKTTGFPGGTGKLLRYSKKPFLTRLFGLRTREQLQWSFLESRIVWRWKKRAKFNLRLKHSHIHPSKWWAGSICLTYMLTRKVTQI